MTITNDRMLFLTFVSFTVNSDSNDNARYHLPALSLQLILKAIKSDSPSSFKMNLFRAKLAYAQVPQQADLQANLVIGSAAFKYTHDVQAPELNAGLTRDSRKSPGEASELYAGFSNDPKVSQVLQMSTANPLTSQSSVSAVLPQTSVPQIPGKEPVGINSSVSQEYGKMPQGRRSVIPYEFVGANVLGNSCRAVPAEIMASLPLTPSSKKDAIDGMSLSRLSLKAKRKCFGTFSRYPSNGGFDKTLVASDYSNQDNEFTDEILAAKFPAIYDQVSVPGCSMFNTDTRSVPSGGPSQFSGTNPFADRSVIGPERHRPYDPHLWNGQQREEIGKNGRASYPPPHIDHSFNHCDHYISNKMLLPQESIYQMNNLSLGHGSEARLLRAKRAGVGQAEDPCPRSLH